MACSIDNEATFLFDLDGTLLDTAPDLTAAVNFARKELLGLPALAPDILRPIVAQGTKAMIAVGTNEESGPISQQKFRRLMLDFYAEHLADATRPFDGINEILNFLDANRRPWGIVTNKLSQFAIPILDKLCLSSRAACVICADMVERAKPAPNGLLLAAQRLSLAPANCAYARRRTY